MLLKHIGIAIIIVFLFVGCSDEEDVFDGDWSGAYTSSSGGNRTLYKDDYGHDIGYEIWAAASSNLRLKWYGKDKRGGSAFKFAWKNSSNAIGRLGWFWNENKPYTDYGDLYCDYAFTKSGTGGGFSYIGIYGWSKSPLMEYYIVEDTFGGQLGKPYDCDYKGEITVDGAKYKVYQGTRKNQPSISGTQTFPQIFSVRQGTRQSGTIPITKHFDEWKKLGITLGSDMYEAKFKVEVGGGTGLFDASLIRFYKPE
uniref:Endo-1,4-beta-xylanase n=1 Tax=uncultured bacterium contig00193 TaxID=1181606 RepID=A0A806KD02_9BACT|nr:xylanase [uncultured bacterium contig00193]